MVTYRYSVRTNSMLEKRGVSRPVFVSKSAPRDSKKLRAEVIAAFLAALAKAAPDDGAKAYLEVSGRSRSVLAVYTHYATTERSETGAPWHGRWRLDDGEEGLPDFVDA